MKKLMLLLVLILIGSWAFGQGFVSTSFSFGFATQMGGGYSETWPAICFDASFVSRFGLELCLAEVTTFKIGTALLSSTGFGLGYAYTNPGRNFTIDGAFMYMPINIYNDEVADVPIFGAKAGFTYWFSDVGISALFNFLKMMDSEFNILSLRAAISIRI